MILERDTISLKFSTETSAKMISSKIIVRSISSSAATLQLVKPPIQLYGLEGRYATALYSAGSKQKSLDKIEQDLVKFQGLMKGDPRFSELIKDPSIKRKLKADALKLIGNKLTLNPASTNLLVLLAENGRLGKFHQITNAYKTIMAANRGEVFCEVTTAKPLDPDTKSKLESVLKSFIKKSETILLDTKVDPTIIGGMVVSIGDKYVDMSVASKIKKYSDLIQSVA